MRVILASLVLLATTPAIAQEKLANFPATSLSPPVEGSSGLQLALKWADLQMPKGRVVPNSPLPADLLKRSEQLDSGHLAVAARPQRSTVGQGGH